MSGMSVSQAVASRRSVRAFTDQPVAAETLRTVFDKARWAPSGCNFQPWEGSLLTGQPLRDLQAIITTTPPQDPLEYSWSQPEALPNCLARYHALGATLYATLGIDRDDAASRQAFTDQNAVSFGAPALLLVHFPRRMGPPQWSDVGMWLQTIMLLLREEGLHSCPQEYLSIHAKVIKQFLGVSDEEHIFFCGLAIGYSDEAAAINHFPRERAPLEENLRFVGF